MNRRNILIALAAAAAFLGTTTLRATTVTWTGGGSGTNWNESANWDAGIPTAVDEAVFTNAGLTDNRVIALGANQSVSNLVLATIRVFTIGNTNDVLAANKLTVQHVDRQDVTGTEGIQTLAVPVVMAGDSTWTVNGSASLRSTSAAGISSGGAGAYTLTKRGYGQLQFGNNTYTGSTFVLEGSLLPTANIGIRGNLYAGSVDGSTTGTVTMSGTSVDRIAGNTTVYPGSTVGFGHGESYANLTIIAGTANINSYNYINGTIRMTGGLLTGGNGTQCPNVTSVATNTTAVLTLSTFAQYGTGANWNWSIADGTAPIDLDARSSLGGAVLNRDFVKSGAGVLLLSKSTGNGHAYRKTLVSTGTLLVGNVSGSATGHSPVQVNAGATLGGTGIIGGVVNYTNSNVNAVGASGNLAVVAPGSLHATTGAHVFGTLTVGSGTQTNNVTLGDYSKLKINIGIGGSQDRLTVNGVLNLASAGNSDTLELSVDPAARGGTYVLASATGGIIGQFNGTVVGKPTSAQLVYNAVDKTLELTIPERGTVLLVR